MPVDSDRQLARDREPVDQSNGRYHKISVKISDDDHNVQARISAAWAKWREMIGMICDRRIPVKPKGQRHWWGSRILKPNRENWELSLGFRIDVCPKSVC
ncbi:unnamed protein product [Euphydryas editha]|uniref:Uncharacterized protein n=1 Tax=Euphydryas editha TaxID=104508 RepID=A0AAU9TYA3_EUPED|nr:unnamed protein product [Euphydryas editha]